MSYNPLFADSVAINDSFNSHNTFYRTLDDSVSLSDALKNNLTKSLTETLSLGDSLSPYWTILRTITETLTISDTFGIGGTVYHRTFGDSLSISDDLTTKALFKPLVDSVTMGDSFARQWTILKTITDILNTSDSITKQTLGRTLEDSISFAEGISNCPKPHISDSVSMSDANTKKIGVKKLETIEFFGPEGRKFKRWNGTAWVAVNTLTVFK
jgi:P2-related tail formation protein